MAKVTIPYTPPDLGPNSDFQTKIFRKNRESVLSELRCLSGIPEIVSTLNQDTVYKIDSIEIEVKPIELLEGRK